MILKSLLFTLILLAVFAGLLSLHKPAKLSAQNQWQDNVIKGQEYIYSTGKNKFRVIVGSSLSCRFVMDSMPADFYNLSFAGKSLFDGMNIVLKSNPKPAAIYIEVNFIKKDSDPSFVDGLFTPLVNYLKEEMPILQEKNQPLTFAGNYLSPGIVKYLTDHFSGGILNPVLSKFGSGLKPQITPVNNFEKTVIEKQVKNFSIPFKEEVIREKFVTLKQDVTQLACAGVRVVFFEMPMHPEIENSVEMKLQRHLFEEYFPAGQFTYLPKPVYADYTTTDGVHMESESALRFTRYFRQFAK